MIYEIRQGAEAAGEGSGSLSWRRILAGAVVRAIARRSWAPEVVKVERPGEGDDTRALEARHSCTMPSGGNLDAAYFHACNRGKESRAIDIATPEGQARGAALVADADVRDRELQGRRAGQIRARSRQSCGRADPRLIVCSITGFGQTGPYAPRAGYDFIIQGMGGFMSLTGEPDGAPQKAGVAYADIFTGVYSAVAILAALRRARRDRRGRAYRHGAARHPGGRARQPGAQLDGIGRGAAPDGQRPRQSGALSGVPAARDGELIIAVGNDSQFRKLCGVLGLDYCADPRFATNPQRVVNRAALIPPLEAAIRQWAKADLYEALEAEGVPAGPINRVDEVFADPQVVARGMRIARGGRAGRRRADHDRRRAHGRRQGEPRRPR